jgi:excinuclease ABC subunit A
MLSRYRGKTKCNSCKGKRLRIETSYVKINSKTVSDLVDLPIKHVSFFKEIKLDVYEIQSPFAIRN